MAENDEAKLKTIKLLPKTDARTIRFGAPWVFADQIVLDRRTRAIDAGEFVTLVQSDGSFLAKGAFNANSKIAFRAMERDENVEIDAAWIFAKLSTALSHRTRIYGEPFYRLVHAEGDGLAGLIIDRFGDYAVVQPNAAWADVHIELIKDALLALGIPNVFLNASGRARKLEGLDDVSRVLVGAMPKPITVSMNNAKYIADLAAGQKTGIFYDQRENHAFAARIAQGEVLDVFSHVGGFGLAMLAGGAQKATAIDASEAALALAQEGANAMGRGQDFTTLRGDAFEVLTDLANEGRKFDVVICDPPAFAPSKQALSAGLRAYERVAKLASVLVKRNGYLGLCSCSHAASPDKFAASSHRGIGRAGRFGQVIFKGAAGPDHPTHPFLDESGYLKSIFLRLD